MVTAEYPGGYIHPWFYPSEEYVQRNHFQESSKDIVDYINNELAVGEDCGVDDGFHDDMMLVAKTSESLIAHNRRRVKLYLQFYLCV